MKTIHLQVSDDLISHYGLQAITQRLQRQLEFEQWQLLAQDIEQATQAADLDHQAVWEEARAEAWEQQKGTYLKGGEHG